MLTHRLVPDYVSGGSGVLSMPCEVIGRSPDYANDADGVSSLLPVHPARRTTVPYWVATPRRIQHSPWLPTPLISNNLFLHLYVRERGAYGGAQFDFVETGRRGRRGAGRKRSSPRAQHFRG